MDDGSSGWEVVVEGPRELWSIDLLGFMFPEVSKIPPGFTVRETFGEDSVGIFNQSNASSECHRLDMGHRHDAVPSLIGWCCLLKAIKPCPPTLPSLCKVIYEQIFYCFCQPKASKDLPLWLRMASVIPEHPKHHLKSLQSVCSFMIYLKKVYNEEW